MSVLPPLRAGYPAPADLAERRSHMPAQWKRGMLAPGVTAEAGQIGDVDCMVCDPPEGKRVLLYFHGGGYRLGKPAAWAAIASRLAAASEGRVIVPDYRLAPENPFPAAIHDALAVYRAVLAGGVVPYVGGDSAGGGLAAALTRACLDLGVTPPAGLVLLSPWLDLTCGNENRAGDPHEAYFSRQVAIEAAGLYLQGHPADDPLASPLFGDLAGFPPTLLFASSAEYLLDDTLAFQARLSHAGVRVEAEIVPGQPHVWPVLAPHAPEAQQVINRIARFMA